MPDEPDHELRARFIRGDEAAFEALVRRFEQDVYRWILRIVRDTGVAEEAAAEAFWRAYRSRARFDPSRSFGAWMRRIATNTALNHLRAARRHARDVSLARPEWDRATQSDGLREAIEIAFRRLPPRLQLVATLALIEQQPYAEIADALDVPLGTVKSRAYRAIRALRKELARLGIHQ